MMLDLIVGIVTDVTTYDAPPLRGIIRAFGGLV